MAELYNLGLIKSAQLAYAINDTQTTMTVAAGQATAFTQPRCVAVLASSKKTSALAAAEHVILESRSGDIYTIERGVAGTAQAWTAGTLVLDYWSPEHFAEVERALDKIEGFLATTLGRNIDGVVRNSGTTYYAVTNPSAYVISCAAGWAIVNEEIVRIDSATVVPVPLSANEGVTFSVYLSPPTQLLPNGVVTYITGTTVPADTLKLAEVSQTATVVTVTDSRVYL